VLPKLISASSATHHDPRSPTCTFLATHPSDTYDKALTCDYLLCLLAVHWDFSQTNSLSGQTALIVGYGSIGTRPKSSSCRSA